MIQSKTKSSAKVSFDGFEGQMVFKLKRTTPGEGSVSCNASLKEGNVKVSLYHQLLNNESELFTINDGESINEYKGYVEANQRYIIIVKSSGLAREGKFEFNLN